MSDGGETGRSVRRAGRFGAAFRRWSAVRLSALAVLIALAALRVWDPIPVETVRLKVFDLYQTISPRDARGLPVLIVDIDENSLSQVGQWPWPRTTIAQLVANLFNNGAVVVGFDVVFAEPDRLSPAEFAESVSTIDPETQEKLKALPTNDAVLANVFKQTRVVVGQAAGRARIRDITRSAPKTTPAAEVGGNPRPFLRAYPSIVRNIPELENAAKGSGMFSLNPEADNIVRRIPIVTRVGGDVFPTLTLEMLRIATGQRAYAIRVDEAGIESVVVSRVRVPTDRDGRAWVRYGPSMPERYVSAVDVLDGTTPRRRLEGKLILIGTSATGLLDIVATPIARAMPGVEVHTQLLENMMTGTFLTRPHFALGAEAVLVVVAGLIIILLVPMVGAWWTLGIGAGLAAGLVGGSWYLFEQQSMLIDVTFAAGVALLLYVMLTVTSYAREEAQRRQIRFAFSRYLAPSVVERLADDPTQLALGGEDREMTLLFSDVQGFTSISENYDAVGLTRLINKILTPLTNRILETGGTVDKYMGDAVMAFWNAPMDDPNHARNACLAALAIRREIAPLNDALRADAEAGGHSYTPINVGVGINTGDCCVGNMGSELRFDYSVLGDTVNIAARLEGQTRTYRVGIAVGETTWEQANDLAFLELDLIRVVGKQIPVRIFTVVGDPAFAQSEPFQKLAAAHGALLKAYRDQEWDRAVQLAGACKELDPGLALDGLYDLYLERTAELREADLPSDWDAVYEATSKY